MVSRLHRCRLILYMMTILFTNETAGIPITSRNGTQSGIKDPIIVSNELVYLQLSLTQRIPCKKDQNDVIVAIWYKDKLGRDGKDIVIRYADSIHGGNYTSPALDGRASLTPDFDLVLSNVMEYDAGTYRCQIIASVAANSNEYPVKVTIIDDKFPKRQAHITSTQVLKPGEHEVYCPVFQIFEVTPQNPTVYWSIETPGETESTVILAARFSDGSILHKDETFDMQMTGDFSLVIDDTDRAQLSEFWCHVSSDVDGINLMSGSKNVTQPQPDFLDDLPWALPVSVALLLTVICLAVYCIRAYSKRNEEGSSEEQRPIRPSSPINSESCTAWKLKTEFGPRGIQQFQIGKSKKSSENSFESLRIVMATSDGGLVLLDNSGLHLMSKELKQKKVSELKCSPDDYVSMAPSSSNEILLGNKNGEIRRFNLNTGEEGPFGSPYPTCCSLGDITADDNGNIYAADPVGKLIFVYKEDGKFNSSFSVEYSPRFLSACGHGELFVSSGVERETIKKYIFGPDGGHKRADFDISGWTQTDILPTRLYANKSSLYVVNRTNGEGTDGEENRILEFSAENGAFQQVIIDGWPEIAGMAFIDEGKLAFFDSKRVQVYKLKNLKNTKINTKL